jgi:2-oxoglutarate ferredoxin oxidoreductase subunit gamma
MARVRIALGGEGGQGVQSIAKILVEAAYIENKNVLYIPNFGIEQRGGVSIAFSQIADEPIGEAKFAKGDIIIMLSDRAIERCAQYVDPKNSIVIYDSSVCKTKPSFEAKEIIGIPASHIALEKLDPKVFNIIILGVIVKATGIIKKESCLKSMEDAFGKKFEARPELKELNLKAFDTGMDLITRKPVEV